MKQQAYSKKTLDLGTSVFKYQLFKETIKHFDVDERWFMEGYNDRDSKRKERVCSTTVCQDVKQ